MVTSVSNSTIFYNKSPRLLEFSYLSSLDSDFSDLKFEEDYVNLGLQWEKCIFVISKLK